MIGNSTIKSLEDTYHFLSEVVPSESQNLVMKTHDRYVLAIQGRIAGGSGRESDFGGKGRRGGRSGGRALEVIYYYYCKEPGHMM